MPFEKQMHIDRTTDIMVGMHGAGLAGTYHFFIQQMFTTVKP
jgi:hypothetical protein